MNAGSKRIQEDLWEETSERAKDWPGIQMQDTLLLRACQTGPMQTEDQEFQRELFSYLVITF